MKLKYKILIELFKWFAKHHLQINTFYAGKTWDFQSAENIYPAMVVLPTRSQFTPGAVRLNMTIFLFDLLKHDNSNLVGVHSDMLDIAGDLIGWFKENVDYPYLTIEDNVSVEPIQEKLSDNVGGWAVNMTFVIDFWAPNCGIPGISDSIFIDPVVELPYTFNIFLGGNNYNTGFDIVNEAVYELTVPIIQETYSCGWSGVNLYTNKGSLLTPPIVLNFGATGERVFYNEDGSISFTIKVVL